MHYVDMAIAFAIFIFFFTYVLFLAINYFTIQPHAARMAEYRQKAIDFFESVFESKGEPEDWEKIGSPAKLGVVTEVYRIPVLVKETSGYSRINEPVALNITFDESCTNKTWNDTIRVYDESGNEIPSKLSDQVFCTGQYLREANVFFEVNISANQNKKYFIYYSSFESVSPPNYSSFDIVAYWKFDEGSGTKAYDTTPNNNDGTLYNGSVICANPPTAGAGCPEWVDGKYGKALSFDGVDDYVEIPSPVSGLPTGSSSRTIAVWVYPEVHQNRLMVWWGNPTSNEGCGFRLSVGLTPSGYGIRWYFWGNDIDVDTGDLSGKWHFLVGTYEENGERKVYVDGRLLDSDTPTPPNTAATHLLIGARDGTEFWDGIIDEVRIYNRALSEQEIIAINNSAPLQVKYFPEESVEILSPIKLDALKQLVYETLRQEIGEEYKFRIEITE